MSGGTALVPELRFPGFEGAWEDKKIGAWFNVSAGGDVPDDFIKVETPDYPYPIYSNSEQREGLYGFARNFRQEGGCITVTGRGSLGVPVARKGPFTPIVRLLVLRPKARSDVVFFENAIRRMHIFVESTGVPQLTGPQISSYFLAAPKIDEQQKIAAFLDAVSKKITLLTEKRDGLVAYKRGVMQRLFSGALRFTRPDGSAFPDWEERKLGDIIRKANSGLSQGSLKLMDEGFPVFGASGLIGYTADFDLDRPFVAIVKDGAGVGNIYNCPARSSAIGTMDCLSEKGDAVFDFIYNLLASLDFGRFATGSTIPHIYFKDYSKLVVPYPHPDEQTKIAEALSALDAKIDAVSAKISQMVTFKKGLLQKMFV